MIIPCDDPVSKGAQRFEIFTGAGKRRDWPPGVKASIGAELWRDNLDRIPDCRAAQSAMQATTVSAPVPVAMALTLRRSMPGRRICTSGLSPG